MFMKSKISKFFYPINAHFHKYSIIHNATFIPIFQTFPCEKY